MQNNIKNVLATSNNKDDENMKTSDNEENSSKKNMKTIVDCSIYSKYDHKNFIINLKKHCTNISNKLLSLFSETTIVENEELKFLKQTSFCKSSIEQKVRSTANLEGCGLCFEHDFIKPQEMPHKKQKELLQIKTIDNDKEETLKKGSKKNELRKNEKVNENLLKLNNDTIIICALCHFLRGSVAGSFAKTIVYPIDRLKMIYQVKGWSMGYPFRMSHFLIDMKSIVKNEGISKLWKGNIATFTRTFFHSGVVYYTYDSYFDFFKSYLNNYWAICRLISGGFAGMTSVCLTYPLDVWNTRMAVSKKATKYHQVTLWKQEGCIGLYRGISPTLCGIFPYAGISFFTFETSKYYIKDCLGVPFSPLHSLICGGLAGVISQTATYPLDTIRKVMQANTFLHYLKEDGFTFKENMKMKNAFLYIYKFGGIRGFYNGVSLNWLKGFLAAGLSFTVNEMFRNLLNENLNCSTH